MHVIIGADHGGFQLKEEVKDWLLSKGYGLIDVGAKSYVEDDDFVDYAKEAVKEATNSEDRIILFCRNGFGMSIVANRFTGVRCGLGFDEGAVEKGRNDDNINCLSIPADYTNIEKVKKMIDVFLEQSFPRKKNIHEEL